MSIEALPSVRGIEQFALIHLATFVGFDKAGVAALVKLVNPPLTYVTYGMASVTWVISRVPLTPNPTFLPFRTAIHGDSDDDDLTLTVWWWWTRQSSRQ